MNTIKIPDKKGVRMVAHRGVSGLERENTNAAFVAAGNRSYFGVETDIHKTGDGKFIIIHDENTKRVSGDSVNVEESAYDTLRQIVLLDKSGKKGRNDLRLPNLEEYISICKYYEKVAVLELKNSMTREEIYEIYDTIEEMDYLDGVIFISFDLNNLIYIRERNPKQKAQYLIGELTEEVFQKLLEHHLDVDMLYKWVSPELVARCHEAGIEVNCWTVDKLEDAEYVIECGVDYITSDILE